MTIKEFFKQLLAFLIKIFNKPKPQPEPPPELGPGPQLPTEPEPAPPEPSPNPSEKGYNDFRLAVIKSESSGNYQVVNSLGYLGAYQFGMARLFDFGMTVRKEGSTGYTNNCFDWASGYSKEAFLNDPALQDEIFRKHVVDLIMRIKKSFGSYLNQTVGGIVITLSGLVAGGHLGGIGGIKRFLESGSDSVDAYGGTVSNYIRKFAGYNLSLS